MRQIKPILGKLKPYLRWFILGATLWFIGSALHQHWGEVKTLRLAPTGWVWLAASLAITLLAHVWTGWVWSWILQALAQPANGKWGVIVYLTTNVAKYLPGNIWHFYGRIIAVKQAGWSGSAATLSVLLESLLMAAAALIVALLNADENLTLQLLCLVTVLAAIHPRCLNLLLGLASRLKGKSAELTESPRVEHYPLRPLLGEIGFVALRGIGFLAAIQALQPVALTQVPATLSAFSVAWVMGLVIPGAPGGIGVFEAVAIALLDQYSTSVVLGGVALYRLISILAEVGGAGLAWLVRKSLA